jgi:hypothetical protein
MNYGPLEFTLVSVLITFIVSMFFTFVVGVTVSNQAYDGDKKLHERIDELEGKLEGEEE